MILKALAAPFPPPKKKIDVKCLVAIFCQKEEEEVQVKRDMWNVFPEMAWCLTELDVDTVAWTETWHESFIFVFVMLDLSRHCYTVAYCATNVCLDNVEEF